MTPKVSVCMITYNHEKFITRAIESVLMQETDFDCELVIGEDCSTDRTRKIVMEYKKKYPDKIRLLLPEKNIGMISNFVQTLKACHGQYVALLEGDDYWTNPLKLQKQADFLDANPDFAICFHNAISMWESGERPPKLLCPDDLKEVSTLEDLIYANIIPTLTVMFRNKLFDIFPSWYSNLKYGDWPLHILNAQYGKIGYINETMAVYRIHQGGVASAAHTNINKYIENMEGLIQLYEVINIHFKYKYKKIIKKRILEYYLCLAKIYRKIGRKRISLKYYLKWIIISPKLTKILYFIKGLTHYITKQLKHIFYRNKTK